MHLYRSKFNITVILILFALLTACTTSGHYAPVKTTNKQVVTRNIQNPIISKQYLTKGNSIATSEMGTRHTATNRQTFHTTELSTRPGNQHPASWNKKSPADNNAAGTKKTRSEIVKTGTKRNKQNSAGKNTLTRQTQTVKSATDKSSSKIRNSHKILPTKLHVTQQPKSHRRKSNASIEDKKMLELRFSWPIKGRVLKSYSPSRNKGIDIAGKSGQPVKAAEAGKVVYGGQGLIGFGKLLIIKHNDIYLSAYANNSLLLVNEGELVKKGQVVAKVGKAGIKRTSLHFEIRKNGKPVNPLKFLPKK